MKMMKKKKRKKKKRKIDDFGQFCAVKKWCLEVLQK